MQSLMKDLAITLADRPGTLAKATEAIAKAGINIEGAAGVPCGGEGIYHVLTTDAAATRRALEGAGFRVSGEQQVLVVDVPDKAGSAAQIFKRLAEANVNVTLFYVATGARIVIGADNVQKANDTLAKQPIATART